MRVLGPAGRVVLVVDFDPPHVARELVDPLDLLDRERPQAASTSPCLPTTTMSIGTSEIVRGSAALAGPSIGSVPEPLSRAAVCARPWPRTRRARRDHAGTRPPRPASRRWSRHRRPRAPTRPRSMPVPRSVGPRGVPRPRRPGLRRTVVAQRAAAPARRRARRRRHARAARRGRRRAPPRRRALAGTHVTTSNGTVRARATLREPRAEPAHRDPLVAVLHARDELARDTLVREHGHRPRDARRSAAPGGAARIDAAHARAHRLGPPPATRAPAGQQQREQVVGQRQRSMRRERYEPALRHAPAYLGRRRRGRAGSVRCAEASGRTAGGRRRPR